VLHSSLNILSLHEFSVFSLYRNLCFHFPLPYPTLRNGFNVSFIRALLLLQWPVRYMFRCYFLLHSSNVAVLFRCHIFYVIADEVTSISSRSISFLTPFSHVACRHLLGAKCFLTGPKFTFLHYLLIPFWRQFDSRVEMLVRRMLPFARGCCHEEASLTNVTAGFFLWGGTYAPVRSLLQVP
jgi:hypothetical protein